MEICQMVSGIFKYAEPQKKRRIKKYNSQFCLHLHNEIGYMYNDEILVQRYLIIA